VSKHCNNPQCFKEKNYEAKSTKTILGKKKRKKFIKKKSCRETLYNFEKKIQKTKKRQ